MLEAAAQLFFHERGISLTRADGTLPALRDAALSDLVKILAPVLDVSAAFWFGAVMSGLMLVLAVLFVPAPQSPAASTAINIRNALLIGGGVLTANVTAILLRAAMIQDPDTGLTAGVRCIEHGSSSTRRRRR